MAGARKGIFIEIRNGSTYNGSLVRRESVTFWFSQEAIARWQHPNDPLRPGHPFLYSDTAIECLLVVRGIFPLPYRRRPCAR